LRGRHVENDMNYPPLPDSSQLRRFALVVLAVALAYFLVGRLALYLGSHIDVMSAIWPAAGVAAAAAVRFRWPAVAGVFFGALATNWGHASQDVLPYLALGAALGAWIFFWLPEKLGGRPFSFNSVRGIARFCLLGLPVGTAVSALVGAGALLNFNDLPQEQYWLVLWSLWSANLAGAILVAPVLLSANLYDWRVQREAFRLEWAAVVLASLLMVWLMLGTGSQQAWKIGEFLLFPLVLWVALRFSAGATTTLVLVVSVVRIASDLNEFNRVELHAPFLEMLHVQVTTLSLAICGLLVTAALAERRESEMRLDRLANHDPLTGLPNRTYFQVYLEHAISQCGRQGGQVSLLFIDLDRFKHINDSRGHEVGDEVLRIVADRLGDVLRGDDFVARLGGDEFAVVMNHPQTLRAARRVALKLIEALSEPFKVGEHHYAVSASIGISVCPDDGSDANTLLRQADMAMYKAKLKRSGFEYFSDDMNAAAHEQLMIENGIRSALRNDDFALLYQPKVDLRTGRMVGMEALIRWMAPGVAGIVGPDKFIPVAEDTGLIVPVGHWVLRTACRQWVEWNKAGLSPPMVSVNLSPRQFTHGGLAREILLTIEDTGMNPAYLGLEITESTAMDNPKTTMQVLAEMSKHGIQMLIDDFGTGHSSLRQLKRLPIDILKIDKSFVQDVLTDKEDAAIANAIINLAHLLDLRVVAEGVETQEVAAFLKEMGCDEIQGYLVGKPMPPDAIKELFTRYFSIDGIQAEMSFRDTALHAG
jgi:diguanylate cyclase (GGDEF)-like protein